MPVEVNVRELKNKFADLAREIMDRIRRDQRR
jgi:antitoxin (DNA-binding transcriptional repressor) of toxin-antitoxin stability system